MRSVMTHPALASGLAGILLGCMLIGCSGGTDKATKPEPTDEPGLDGPAWFEDVTDKVGLNFVHDCGPTGNFFLPQVIGSGAAFLDFDGDGLLDIYLVQNGGPSSRSTNRLFHQERDGTFKDVTEGSGLGASGYGMGVAVGDVNNDGRPDILLTEYGRIRLFLNLGGGKFEDISAEAGLVSPLWGTSAAFLDYNRDGWLDLVVVNYVDYDAGVDCTSRNGAKDFCAPTTWRNVSSKLFKNTGPRIGVPGQPDARVTFRDESLASGIGKLPAPGLGVAVADFDGDGWPDIFIANDAKPNHLWINKRDGTFAEEALVRGVAMTGMGKSFAGMGVAIGDADNDGLLDLYVSHLTSETNTLWRQTPRGLFRDETAARGLTGTKWRGTGFGTVMADFDHDGALDIAVVNGRVTRGEVAPDAGLPEFWKPYAERNQIFANTGDGSFRDVSPRNKPFCGYHNVGRGLVCGDFDNDGALDLLVTTIGGKARLFRNVAPNRGHWLKIRAIDPELKRDAYGAEITVRAGEHRWFRVLSPAESYLCSGPPIAHFGLGGVAQITGIEVLWPDGTREAFPGGAVDQAFELRRGTGRKL